DAGLILVNRSDHTFYDGAGIVTLHPMADTKVQLMTGDEVDRLELTFEVLNAVKGPHQHPRLVLDVIVQQ
ncbi:MAG: Sb-PDE family phosphodiesterase, partial [Saprospiraceae bacterium]|nr:Sb-PDE family phosphodiesterase [Saprospiraceae bacterium]